MSTAFDSSDDRGLLDDLKRRVVGDLELAPERIAALGVDTPIVEGLALDSLRQVILLTRVEEEYGFEFDETDLQQLQAAATLGDLVHIIRRRAGAGAS